MRNCRVNWNLRWNLKDGILKSISKSTFGSISVICFLTNSFNLFFRIFSMFFRCFLLKAVRPIHPQKWNPILPEKKLDKNAAAKNFQMQRRKIQNIFFYKKRNIDYEHQYFSWKQAHWQKIKHFKNIKLEFY